MAAPATSLVFAVEASGKPNRSGLTAILECPQRHPAGELHFPLGGACIRQHAPRELHDMRWDYQSRERAKPNAFARYCTLARITKPQKTQGKATRALVSGGKSRGFESLRVRKGKGVQPPPNSHNFSHTPRNNQKRHATPGNRFPFVLRGFLNDSGHSVDVGDFSLERTALNAAREIRGFGDAEVGELDLAGVAEKHVRGRDVAVDDAGGVAFFVYGVREVERGRERVCDVRREARVERFSTSAQMAQHRTEVGAFDQLEREVVGAVGDAEVEHACDVPVMQERR